jgi:hypothetical protein
MLVDAGSAAVASRGGEPSHPAAFAHGMIPVQKSAGPSFDVFPPVRSSSAVVAERKGTLFFGRVSLVPAGQGFREREKVRGFVGLLLK